MQKEKKDYYKITKSNIFPDFDKILKAEMSVFESTSIKGKYLGIAYKYLTITPTSVEAERAFSAAGYLCNNLRSRIGDETINSLCFLRAYFENATN